LRSLFGLTLYDGRRTHGARARSRERALGRRRTLYNRATRARARRALSSVLLTAAIVNNDRLGLRDTALQYILAQVRDRRALCL